MDIVNVAMAISQADLATQVSTSVTKMSMDDCVESASKMTEMIGNPNLGNSIDARA